MKSKIISWIYSNSFKIVSYSFWIYFLFIIVFSFIKKQLTELTSYVFWILLGIYLGYSLAIRAVKYLEKERNYKEDS